MRFLGFEWLEVHWKANDLALNNQVLALFWENDSNALFVPTSHICPAGYKTPWILAFV
jgi:hypothetical protein